MTEKQLPVSEVAARLGVSLHSLYAWIKRYTKLLEQRVQEDDQSAELRRLRAELKRVDVTAYNFNRAISVLGAKKMMKLMG
ncbi:transposase [Pseudomonas sp. JAI115]|nr:transposase [Pseudomonas sp. JAI115]